jgi:branched-chain amino acid aminotransferase
MTQKPGFKLDLNPSPLDAKSHKAAMADPAFGRIFTDHMATITWHDDRGWHDARITARAPFSIDPACSVLHYGQEIFEGMKAYRGADGAVTLFRPLENARRFQKSAERMAMPVLPEELFLEAVEQLVRVDQAWVPGGSGSLYLRPFMFATEVYLGIKPASEFIFCVIACPVGPYIKTGDQGVPVWVSQNYTRAARHGTGAAKCGGNYAGSLIAQNEATANGCSQVVFLDAAEHRWIEELGGMNVFFVFADGSLVTPPLGGTILPGITRASVIELARDMGHSVTERLYALDEWGEDAKSGRLVETFMCGTAATIVSIGEVRSAETSFLIGGGISGETANALNARLSGIQRGEIAGPKGWVHSVKL